jgi:predicted FMN-binding regulatory protein PaiB
LYLPKNHPSKGNQAVIDHLSKANIQLAEYEPEFPEKTLVVKNSLNHYIYSSLKEPIEWEGIGLQRAVRTDK